MPSALVKLASAWGVRKHRAIQYSLSVARRNRSASAWARSRKPVRDGSRSCSGPGAGTGCCGLPRERPASSALAVSESGTAQLQVRKREPLQDPLVVVGGVRLDGGEETAVEAVEAAAEPLVVDGQLDLGGVDG